MAHDYFHNDLNYVYFAFVRIKQLNGCNLFNSEYFVQIYYFFSDHDLTKKVLQNHNKT